MWVLLTVLVAAGIACWVRTRLKNDRKIPESYLYRYRCIRDLPVGCDASISHSSVVVDMDGTCYLHPGGFYFELSDSSLRIHRKRMGYILVIPQGTPAFVPRAIRWQRRISLLRVVRYESASKPPSSIDTSCRAAEIVDTPAGDASLNLSKLGEMMTTRTTILEPSYQTAPLDEYNLDFRLRAERLFECVSARVDRNKAKRYKGSFSILAGSGTETAAKIVIFESNKGKTFGPWPDLNDGVYVLLRARGQVRDHISTPLTGKPDIDNCFQEGTIGIAPKYSERFAYFQVEPTVDLEEISESVAKFAVHS